MLLLKEDCCCYDNFGDFVADKGNRYLGGVSDNCFHLGLLPVPYVGNLETASIYVVMLNPGFAPNNYLEKENISGINDTLIRCIHQNNKDDEYPFFFLNPRFAWHGGWTYWSDKLREIINCVIEFKKVSYNEALKILAHQLACIELFPYHSKSFRLNSSLHNLKSCKLMVDYIRNVLTTKAKNNEAIVLIVRGEKYVGLKESKNVVIYKGSECRSAHLTLKSRGGGRIAEWLHLV